MSAARLRRTGFAATLAAGTLMLGSAVHGMTRVDTTLEVAAAAQRDRPVFVVDARPEPGHAAVRVCDEPRTEPRQGV